MYNANEKLIDILSFRRQHGGLGVAEMVEKYILPLQPVEIKNSQGEVMAYVLVQGDDNKIMWSSHVDTVHYGMPEVVRQEVFVSDDGVAFVAEGSGCLGGDDGAGVWLMLEMYDAGVSGTYVWHCGEERGCIGSKWISHNMVDWLEQFTHAIAFDRRGNTSIITHQMGSRACSDATGNKLIELFDMGHELDPTGVYTDTAQYMDIIPECVNISIGYQNEHSSRETLDLDYVQELRDRIINIDWSLGVLPVGRDPAVIEYEDEGMYSYSGWGVTKQERVRLDPTEIPTFDELYYSTYDDVVAWVKEAAYSDIAAAMLDMVDRAAQAEEELANFYGGVQ